MSVDAKVVFAAKLRGLIDKRGISQRQLARVSYCDPGYLSRILSAKKSCSEKVAKALDVALGANGELLALRPLPAESGAAPTPPQSASHGVTHGLIGTAGSGGGIVDQSPTPDMGDDDVKRRAALRLIAAISAGATVPPGTIEAILSDIESAIGNPVDLDEWEGVVQEYGQQILIQPAGSLTHDLTADAIAIGEVLKRPLEETHKTGVLRVAAGLSSLLAIDLSDVGDKRAARVTWGSARRAADASGDRELRVWVRAKEAQKGCWEGRSYDAVSRLCSDAVQIAEEKSSPGLARAYAALAYIAAERGNSAEANSALYMFKRTFDDLPESMRTTYSQTPSSLHEGLVYWSEAYVHTILGDQKADAAISRAQALSPGLAVNEELELFRALSLVSSHEINIGLAHALSTIRTRPFGTFRLRVAKRMIMTLPRQARTLPAARQLHELTLR